MYIWKYLSGSPPNRFFKTAWEWKIIMIKWNLNVFYPHYLADIYSNKKIKMNVFLLYLNTNSKFVQSNVGFQSLTSRIFTKKIILKFNLKKDLNSYQGNGSKRRCVQNFQFEILTTTHWLNAPICATVE